MHGKRILLIVGGGIAAYKACELVRLIGKAGGSVTCVLTEGGAHFVTPMTLAALSGNKVHTTLWDLKDEAEMGHIQLSRQADLVVVCPATADLLAKMHAGMADDLATTLLLATDKPVLAVPAMNVRMWLHPATQRNVHWLASNGVTVLEPDEGPMACGEYGPGRLPEPPAILAAIEAMLGAASDAEPSLPFLIEGAGSDLYAALEPEPEGSDAGFGGLSAGLIVRGAPPAATLPGDSDGPVDFVPDVLPVPLPETFAVAEAAAPAAAGPLLAKKGRARAAPPTDVTAINHLVSGEDRSAPPEVLGAPQPAAAQLPAEPGPLAGRHVLITAGPTHEAIDPVRYIANRSSGKQGFAIAAAAAAAGARVTLVSGPVHLPTPPGVDRVDIESAREMADAVKAALPADVGIMVAAVADWRTAAPAEEKIKKRGAAPPALMLTENPDILATVAGSPQRPGLLIGFAAETEKLLDNAAEKLRRKGADWIIANDVSSGPGGSVMGGEVNAVHIVTRDGIDSLPEMPKDQVAEAIVARIAETLGPLDDGSEADRAA